MADEEKLHPRAARIRYELSQDCLAHLEFARHAKLESDGDCAAIAAVIEQVRNNVLRYGGWANERIQPRRRVPVVQRNEHSEPRREFLIFLDECGVHSIDSVDDAFPVFCLCAVIVDRERFTRFDRLWKTWKATWLGSWQVRVHEPDVRRRSDRFHDEDPQREQALIDSLSAQLSELDFTCIAAVIDKRQLRTRYPAGKVDDFLPVSTFLMCIDFIFERVVHFLYYVGDDAQGIVIAEARGPREDAEVHAEFLRLHLLGTQYIADGYFRNQLRPYIEFRKKDRNDSGLQIADLAARPIADKVLRPDTTPERWQAIAAKIYDGNQQRRSSYGLKVFPAAAVASIFGETLTVKANKDAKASLSTDPQVRVHSTNDTP